MTVLLPLLEALKALAGSVAHSGCTSTRFAAAASAASQIVTACAPVTCAAANHDPARAHASAGRPSACMTYMVEGNKADRQLVEAALAFTRSLR